MKDLAKFESYNVNFENKTRYTFYDVSYKVDIQGILLEPMAFFYTLKGYFMCNQHAMCLN